MRPQVAAFGKVTWGAAPSRRLSRLEVERVKSYRHLYEQVCTWENLYGAWRRARRGKRGREPAATFEFNLEENLLCVIEPLFERCFIYDSYANRVDKGTHKALACGQEFAGCFESVLLKPLSSGVTFAADLLLQWDVIFSMVA